MFKLKLVSKPKVMKLKCNFSFPNIVLANLQKKEVIPSKEVQEITADVPYDGLSKVIVDKIPDEYIIPAGEIEITQNGTYDVTDKASANVNIPEKKLGTKTITQNGVYKATDDNLDGYSEVDVNVQAVSENNAKIQVDDSSFLSSVGSYLIKIEAFDCSKKNNLVNTFYGISDLEYLGGLINLGKAYSTAASENNYSYRCELNRCSKLTHESLINVINSLYDIKTAGVKPQQLILGSTNISKLSAEEISLGTSKGWTLS